MDVRAVNWALSSLARRCSVQYNSFRQSTSLNGRPWPVTTAELTGPLYRLLSNVPSFNEGTDRGTRYVPASLQALTAVL